MLSLSRIRMLVATDDAGSIVKAAELLRYTPSALSQQLQTLEAELGVQLIVRGARGSRLTPAGAELARRGRSLLAQAEVATAATQAAALTRGGLLRVCTFPSAGATLLPSAFAALRRGEPALEIRLLEREPRQAVQLAERHEVDVALTFTYTGLPGLDLPARSQLVATPVRTERMLLALPINRSVGSGELSIADLDVDWIDNRDWGPGLRLLAFLSARAGIHARTTFETDDYQIALALVEAGLGAALVPESVAQRDGVVFRELDSHPHREILAITSGAPQGSAQLLLDELHLATAHVAPPVIVSCHPPAIHGSSPPSPTCGAREVPAGARSSYPPSPPSR